MLVPVDGIGVHGFLVKTNHNLVGKPVNKLGVFVLKSKETDLDTCNHWASPDIPD